MWLVKRKIQSNEVHIPHQGARTAVYLLDTTVSCLAGVRLIHQVLIRFQTNSPAGSENDKRTEEVQRRVDQRSSEGDGRGVKHGNDFCRD